jgi:hypothetical protein
MVERSEFELPVPVSKLSDDSVVLFNGTRRSRTLFIATYPWLKLHRLPGQNVEDFPNLKR